MRFVLNGNLNITLSNQIIIHFYRNIAMYLYSIQMGVTKTEMFSDVQNQISLYAKVIGHPARVAILQHLIKTNSCICGDLVDEIGLAQPTISQHLKELKNIGLIQGDIEGTSVCYCINQTNWNTMKSILQNFLNQDLTTDSECC